MYAYGFVIDEIIIQKSCNDIPISSYFSLSFLLKNSSYVLLIWQWARMFSLWHHRKVQSLSLKELQLCHVINLFNAFKENSQNWETVAQGQRPRAKVSQHYLSTERLFPRRYRMSYSLSHLPFLSEDNNSVLQRLCECLNVMYIVTYICHDQVNVAKMLKKDTNLYT